jgi:hypothetical protein
VISRCPPEMQEGASNTDAGVCGFAYDLHAIPASDQQLPSQTSGRGAHGLCRGL